MRHKNTETENRMDLKDTKPIAEELLSISQADRLAELPLKCLLTEYPNKLSQTLANKEDIEEPRVLHPAFYGCFDWHSAVHGHWSLVRLLKAYPNLDKATLIKQILKQHISKENIEKEVSYFERKYEKSYERTYGWAWLLKLAEEIKTWDDPLAKTLDKNLQPLTDKIISKYLEFLPNLRYPIRVGTHTNTAFGLTFAWDYAVSNHIDTLKALIAAKSREFYLADESCPINWEPGGYDFLSPCLEEIDLMRRVLGKKEFKDWISKFTPQLSSKDFSLEQGEVSDRTDGLLVHLDGLNFSRAWVLYGLANQYPEFSHLRKIADQHIKYSLEKLTDGNYEGEHWLATFAIYALSNSGSAGS